jgi:hypothetical protein
MNRTSINRTSINGGLLKSVVIELASVRDVIDAISSAFTLFGFYDDGSTNLRRRMYAQREDRDSVLAAEGRLMIVAAEPREMAVEAQDSLAAISQDSAFEAAPEERLMVVPSENRTMVTI